MELYGLPTSDEQRLCVTLSSLKNSLMEVFSDGSIFFFYGYARDRVIWFQCLCLFCRAWLKRENLASYKKFRKDFNEQVRYLLYLQACCRLPK